jgi:hypothetical protein
MAEGVLFTLLVVPNDNNNIERPKGEDFMRHARKDYQRRIVDLENVIPEDEPVFLLRGQDIFAARVVRFWAALVAQHDGDPAIVTAAMNIADEMDKWGPHKTPDLPEGS